MVVDGRMGGVLRGRVGRGRDLGKGRVVVGEGVNWCQLWWWMGLG